ncbi:MAG: nucleotidyltransferase domain-containing protein [Acidobacteria bacterium]|nr:nucleotidyltransferase domain-containing protein [Acidobacteriota bacterium]
MPQELAVRENVRQALAELRRRFEALYGERLLQMILYGSQARGDARPWSDIDVLVVLRGHVDDWRESHRTETIVGEVCLQFDVVIMCFFVAEEDYTSGDGALLRSVRREGVPV